MERVNVPKSIWNIAAVLEEFFPDKMPGVDYSIADPGGDCFVVKCEFDLPSLDEMMLRANDLALAAGIEQALLRIDQFHSDTVQALVGSPTQVEKDTWSLKLEAAGAIIKNTQLSGACQAFLAGAGMTTDADKKNWATSVLAKSAAYAQVVGLAELLRARARAAVKGAVDAASLTAILDAQRAAADEAVEDLLKSGA
jgi:hypothetical protein